MIGFLIFGYFFIYFFESLFIYMLDFFVSFMFLNFV